MIASTPVAKAKRIPMNMKGGMRATASFTTVNVAPQMTATPMRASSQR